VSNSVTPFAVVVFALTACILGGCPREHEHATTSAGTVVVTSVPPRAPVTGTAATVVAGAHRQVREAATYTTGYVVIPYPGGDLPRDQGVCTDVIVRALRHAGYDLQKLIHEDMVAAFSSYPRRWGLKRPDPNIDHRRVPNQKCYFGRHGLTLPLDADWRPGDFVYWDLGGGLDHCGVVSDGRSPAGHPLVIHNIGVCTEDDCFRTWPITGHYRFPSGS